MGPQELAAQVAGIAALDEPVRRSLYLYVVVQREPVNRDQAAGGVGVPRHVAKFHLDRLVAEGLLDVDFKRLPGRAGPGAGRPAKRYRRSGKELAVSVPERRYDLAADLLAQAIDESVRTGSVVTESLHEAASRQGASLGQSARALAGAGARRSDRIDATCRTLAAYGYEPRAEGQTVVLANCPFHQLAQQHTELVCGMNLSLLEATLNLACPEDLAASLSPAQGRCCVVLEHAS